MPKVSVVIPAYNAEKFIEKCLLSLKEQTFKDFEIIVVDDCSKDRTYEIASKYAHVIKNEKNLGVGESRNVGARASRGEILVFTDSDVVTLPNWLHRIIDTMTKLNLKCVGGGYCGSIGNTFIQDYAYHELEFRRASIGGFVYTLVSNNFACHRDLFFKYGGFPADGYKCEDLRLSYLISREQRVFWDKENGVFHHFRNSLSGYLKQQYLYSRDTVITYYEFPRLFFTKTHQGRSVYLETILAFFLVCTLVASFFRPIGLLIAFILFLIIFLVKLQFLRFLRSKRQSVIKGAAVSLSRDFFAVAGFFSGIILCVSRFLTDQNGIIFKSLRSLRQLANR
jgi:glycosyltransferase involved in cell wall biosynthesis